MNDSYQKQVEAFLETLNEDQLGWIASFCVMELAKRDLKKENDDK